MRFNALVVSAFALTGALFVAACGDAAVAHDAPTSDGGAVDPATGEAHETADGARTDGGSPSADAGALPLESGDAVDSGSTRGSTPTADDMVPTAMDQAMCDAERDFLLREIPANTIVDLYRAARDNLFATPPRYPIYRPDFMRSDLSREFRISHIDTFAVCALAAKQYRETLYRFDSADGGR